ncbi:storkhead-box protein 1-like isoform 2-T3 [Theristicus caerulescens]
MPRRAERCLQIAPHSLAIVLGAAAGGRAAGGGGAGPAAELGRHRIGYEIFADFKRENMQHFWDRRATAAVAETFFLGWIDEQVLLVQGKEEHLEVLRQGWARRSLKPPSGFHIKYLAQQRCCVFCRAAGRAGRGSL